MPGRTPPPRCCPPCYTLPNSAQLGLPRAGCNPPPRSSWQGIHAAARRKRTDPWPEMKPLFTQISQIPVLGITLMLFSSDKCLIYFPS